MAADVIAYRYAVISEAKTTSARPRPRPFAVELTPAFVRTTPIQRAGSRRLFERDRDNELLLFPPDLTPRRPFDRAAGLLSAAAITMRA